MNEELRKTYDALVADTKEISDLDNIQGLLGWDQETYMPPKGIDAKSRQLSLMAGIVHRRQTDLKRGEWLTTLRAAHTELSEGERATVRELSRTFDRLTKLPPELVEEQSRVCAHGHEAWIKARKASDFSIFAPWLEKVIGLKRRIAEHWGYAETPYDAMLDDYEPGATARSTGEVLEGLRVKLVPWVKKIAQSSFTPRTDFFERGFPAEAQRQVAERTIALIGFDTEAGRLDVSAHPFCTGTGGDVRLTTRFLPNLPFASFFGVIHEAGHGMYEQGLPPEHLGAPLGVSCSMSIHESQSRMWENIVGRSRPFLSFVEPMLRDAFPRQLEGVTLDELCGAVNQVKPSLIRVEADEVTYGLHIVVRFEIERDLMSGALSVGDLPRAWNAKMQEYLGVTPPDDSQGCLQDIHWSLGYVGYFPSYALGSLNAAQFFAAYKRAIPDLEQRFAKGDFSALLSWLRQHIHSAGRQYLPNGLVEHVTGRSPSADDFMDYIAAKYGSLYRV